MTNRENQIDVVNYIQQIKTELIRSIRLMEVDISRKFDDIIYVAEAMSQEIASLSKTESKPNVEVETSEDINDVEN